MTSKCATYALAAMLCVTLCGCATMRGWFGGSDKKAPDTSTTEVVVAAEPADHEEQLRQTVRQYVASSAGSREQASSDLIRRKPYFYKEYVEFPQGADNMQVLISETESRTAPYQADVTLSKLRFATRMHLKRDEANADSNFLRDTGTETLTLEYRNGQWVKLGSLFVADKTEENINGEWVPLQEEVMRMIAEEEDKGWFTRTWARIRGRD